MSVKQTTPLAAALAAEIKSQLDGGRLYIFAGSVPATAGEALSTQTLLIEITKDGDGVTGLTFDAPTTGVLVKAAAETWEGDTEASGTASFYRFCEASDDGTGAATTECRIQGRCGSAGDPIPADLIFPTTVFGASGISVPIAAFSFTVPLG